MACDICRRAHDAQRLPFLCAVDARNQAYEGRIKHLQLLVQNESLQEQIHRLLEGSQPAATRDAAADARLRAEDETGRILAAAERLRGEIRAARDEVKARRAALGRRRSDLASVSEGLAERRAAQVKEVTQSSQTQRKRWAQGAEDMARTRAFLCLEAARLYGLRRVKGPSARYSYYLGRLPVVDLAAMNSLSPDVISTSLAHLSHILMLASHYLAVRLPAEITLPHRDYPRPTIFNLAGSYRNGDQAFPSTPGVSIPASNPRDADAQPAPRPRPLFIDKELPQLAKEDPAAYSFFLEGVTLLSYDVAWLCCTQGVLVGDKGSFEDICNMGRNLYNLLVSQQSHGATNFPAAGNPELDPQNVSPAPSWVGRYSHGTMFYFLGAADGTELVKTFKLPGPMKLADKLKKKLVGDAPAPDWEVLEDDAWKVEDAPDEDLLVETPTAKMPVKAKAPDGKGSPKTGSGGWMKVKSR